jgi:hypothetical protein
VQEPGKKLFCVKLTQNEHCGKIFSQIFFPLNILHRQFVQIPNDFPYQKDYSNDAGENEVIANQKDFDR